MKHLKRALYLAALVCLSYWIMTPLPLIVGLAFLSDVG